MSLNIKYHRGETNIKSYQLSVLPSGSSESHRQQGLRAVWGFGLVNGS